MNEKNIMNIEVMDSSSTTAEISEKVPLRTKLFYGVGDVGNGILNTAISFFLLLFYTDAVGISPALASSAMLVGKIWDAVNDPLFGWISDKTKSKFGKRRVYMIFGALPLGVFASLLWLVPANLNNVFTFLWIAGSFILFDTFMTVTSTPYYSLTAELTRDYNERANLTAYRMVFGVIAFMIGAAGTPFFVSLFDDPRNGYKIVGVIYGVVCTIVLWICSAGVHEREDMNEVTSQSSPFKSAKIIFQNKPFVLLIVIYLLAQLGFTLIQTLLAYYLTYQLFMEKQVTLVMVVLLVCVLIFIFPWRSLIEKWNKGPAYALGLGIAGAAMFATFFLPNHPTWLIYLLAGISGVGFSAQWIIPWAMIPDVVDYDQADSGEGRSGMYYGLWGFTSKLTAALGITMAGWMLELSGYVPNVAQSASTLTSIRFFFGVIPAIMFFIVVPMLAKYPITRDSHKQVLEKMKA